MRPLGLEGKVGAPAIVRENPLRRLFTSYADGVERNDAAARDTLIDALEGTAYRWADMLDVISHEYPARTRRLGEFVSSVSARCIDHDLVYDLDTPELSLHFLASRRNGAKAISLRGACGFLSVWIYDDLIVSGVVEVLSSRGELSIINGHVGHIYLEERSNIVISPAGVVDRAVFLNSILTINDSLAGMIDRSVILADRPVPIDHDDHLYLTADPRVRPLYRDCLSAAEDPARLMERSSGLRRRFDDLRNRTGEFRQDATFNTEVSR